MLTLCEAHDLCLFCSGGMSGSFIIHDPPCWCYLYQRFDSCSSDSVCFWKFVHVRTMIVLPKYILRPLCCWRCNNRRQKKLITRHKKYKIIYHSNSSISCLGKVDRHELLFCIFLCAWVKDTIKSMFYIYYYYINIKCNRLL